jgi:hypothetical protein
MPYDLLAIGGMKLGEHSIKAWLVGCVHRMEHTSKLVIKGMPKMWAASQQIS